MSFEFMTPGKASFIVGGQWGSCGKGAVSAWIANNTGRWDIVTTNAGSQSGHTSIHEGRKAVLFHLPTAPLVQENNLGVVYLNAGAVIDPGVLMDEIKLTQSNHSYKEWRLYIHPNAAIITEDAKAAERDMSSPQAKIASTQKGVGETIARKVRRSGLIARDCPGLAPMIRRIDLNLRMSSGKSVLVEVPQGIGLSLNGKFYPHATSRDSTIMQAMSDAQIHPEFLGKVALVLRTHPIRVGNLEGNSSGDCYPDQKEISWNDIGVEPEITTVTKRVRRVFTFSMQQLWDALIVTRPDVIHLTFCDYIKETTMLDGLVKQIINTAKSVSKKPLTVVCHNGPTTEDAKVWGRY